MTDAPAVFSPCRTYRYLLRRRVSLESGVVLWVMLNPSTADERVEDPTIRRCTDFTRRWNYGTLEVVNLYALRATDPRELLCHTDPVGPENDTHIVAAMRRATFTILAWGASPEPLARKASVTLLAQQDVSIPTPYVLGWTKDGHPRHPLYVPRNRRLEMAW